MNIFIQIIESLFSLIESLLKSLFEIIENSIWQLPKKNEGYNAEFTHQGLLLSRKNTGFCLTGRRNLSQKHSYQNALIVGGTGTGKSSVVLIPSLFTMEGSFVVHDPSGELFSKSSGYLSIRGYDIKTLNFTLPRASYGYNPLIRANTSSDIQKIASMLIGSALGKAKDPFWNIQGISLLTILISLLKKHDQKFQNLYNVRLLLNAMGSNPEFIDKLFSEHADELLFAEYKSFLSYDEKVVNGVIATCKAALQLFNDESIAQVTSFENLDFQNFRNKPTVLFIQNSVADQKYYSVLTSLFFEQFFSFLLGRFPQQNEQDIFLLIDEASSLNLPTLPLAVANVRKHRSGVMLLVQDISQLVHNYGREDAEAIKSNCFSKLFFTGQSLETSKDLEQILGLYQYEDKYGVKITRPLMTSDEIRTMSIKNALLISGHHRPILTKLKPYYKSKRFLENSSLPKVVVNNKITFKDIPTLLTVNSDNSHE